MTLASVDNHGLSEYSSKYSSSETLPLEEYNDCPKPKGKFRVCRLITREEMLRTRSRDKCRFYNIEFTGT